MDNPCKYSPDGRHDRSEVCVYCHNAELERLQARVAGVEGLLSRFAHAWLDGSDAELDVIVYETVKALQETYDDGKN